MSQKRSRNVFDLTHCLNPTDFCYVFYHKAGFLQSQIEKNVYLSRTFRVLSACKLSFVRGSIRINIYTRLSTVDVNWIFRHE